MSVKKIPERRLSLKAEKIAAEKSRVGGRILYQRRLKNASERKKTG